MNIVTLMGKISAQLERRWPLIGSRLALMVERRQGEPEFGLLDRLVDRKRLALDIGANRGMYTGALLPLSTGVVAFEPNPVMAEQARRSWPRARIEQCALGDTVGEAELCMPVSATGTVISGFASIAQGKHWERERRVTVPVRRLDDFDLHDVGFIKIDVEGYELATVRGGWQTILRERPVMLIESESAHAAGCPGALVNLLGTINYTAHFFDGHNLQPFSAWNESLRARHYDGPINNFIFMPCPV